MIIVDNALKQRQTEGNPVRVGLIGAGYMARGIAYQILKAVPGMDLVGIYSRIISNAVRAYADGGVVGVKEVKTAHALDDAIKRGERVVTDDPSVICEAAGIDAIIEVTGTIEFGARIVLQAIENRKHVVLMNAELDATLGPILKVHADRAGVVYTTSDGDQPGVILNLFRWVESIGMRPVLAGNMKGLQDPYRTPETQKEYAAKYKQKPHMVTSFADGTKISMEMAVVANATGFRAGKRGMYGPRCNHVNDAMELFPKDQMLNGGLVDYVLGAEPAAGVFVIGYSDEPLQREYMYYYKMGDGPFYVFYTPYHLCHLEAPLTVARAVLFGDAAAAPAGGPVCDVISVAKRDLKAGEILDGMGGFTCYGMIENTDMSSEQNLLPIGVSEGCKLVRDVGKDGFITYEDVELPGNRLCDKLRVMQNDLFRIK
jgi:predicted homoserine dehydrogenase-like protein